MKRGRVRSKYIFGVRVRSLEIKLSEEETSTKTTCQSESLVNQPLKTLLFSYLSLGPRVVQSPVVLVTPSKGHSLVPLRDLCPAVVKDRGIDWTSRVHSIITRSLSFSK